jgi:hypothetical protein
MLPLKPNGQKKITGVHDRILPDLAISMHVTQSAGEPSETQHSGQIGGDRHPADHHLGVNWNPRTATLFARSTCPHVADQLHGRLVVEEK